MPITLIKQSRSRTEELEPLIKCENLPILMIELKFYAMSPEFVIWPKMSSKHQVTLLGKVVYTSPEPKETPTRVPNLNKSWYKLKSLDEQARQKQMTIRTKFHDSCIVDKHHTLIGSPTITWPVCWKLFTRQLDNEHVIGHIPWLMRQLMLKLAQPDG